MGIVTMDKILVINKTTDGKVYSSSWGHQDIADKVERFLKTKHPDSIVYQVVASSSEISKQITFNP